MAGSEHWRITRCYRSVGREIPDSPGYIKDLGTGAGGGGDFVFGLAEIVYKANASN